jgi:hypothetical protein
MVNCDDCKHYSVIGPLIPMNHCAKKGIAFKKREFDDKCDDFEKKYKGKCWGV